MAVVLTLSLVILVRGVQGAPPADDWSGLTGVSSAPSSADSAGAGVGVGSVGVGSGAGVTTYTVGVDDTWAGIAAEVAPGVDPVEVARQLAGINGGYALQPGQVLTISLQL